MTDSTELRAKVPAWVRDMVEPDIKALGVGERNRGGPEGVVGAACYLYAMLPERERRRLANLMKLKDESIIREFFEDEAVIRAIRAAIATLPGATPETDGRQTRRKRT